MKTTAIVTAALLTTAFMFMGKGINQNYYLAALATWWAFLLLTVGRDCQIVRLLGRLGVGGLSCPADRE